MGFVGPSHITPEQSQLIQRIQLAEQFGWPWEYFDDLSVEALGAILSYNSGMAKGRED